MNDYIDVNALVDSLDYSKEDNELVRQAFKVLRGLNKFLNDRQCEAVAHLEITPATISVGIRGTVYWDSECNNEEDLTEGFILGEYEADLREQMQLLKEDL